MTAPVIEKLHEQLRYGTQEEAAAAAHQLADIQSAEDTEVVVTVHDKFWGEVGQIGDYIELSMDIPRNKVPTLDVILKGGDGFTTGLPTSPDPHIPRMRRCREELVGITVEVGNLREAFFVDHTKYSFRGGKRQLLANCLGIWDLLHYMYVVPSWWLPLAAQPISHAVYIGPIVSVRESMTAETGIRIQVGLWEFVNQAGSLNPDFRAWVGTLLQSKGNLVQALKTPMYVKRTPLLKDTSMMVARTVRMERVGAVIEDITKAYGVDVRMHLWKPGDPQPDKWADLNQPTYVVSVTDRLSTTGPTSTIADSILKTVVDITGSLFGEIGDIIKAAPGAEGVFISKLAGVDFEQPIAVLVDGPDNAFFEFDIDDYHPRGHTMILGGRSPTWVGAPGLIPRGHRPRGLTMSQQPDQHFPELADRQHHHLHRNHRRPKQFAGWFSQRRIPGLPDHPDVRPPRQGRTLWPSRVVPPHRLGPVQRRGHLFLRQPRP